MKYKKYLVFIMFLMIFSVDKIYAETCYYQTSEVALKYDSDKNQFTIRQREDRTNILFDNEPLVNRYKSIPKDDFTELYVAQISTEFPAYIVYRRKDRLLFDSDGIFGFDNSQDAQKFASASKQIAKMYVWSSDLKAGMTEEEFNNGITQNVNSYKRQNTDSGANPNAHYGSEGIETSDGTMTCEELFDSSIIELINDILKYTKYIVPGIILVLGTLDLFKAVIAGKEDEMKKAQKTFIKRVIIGVCVFLVPVFINAIIWIANIAWQGLGYATCSL